MDKNNLNDIKKRVSDFLCDMYNFQLSKPSEMLDSCEKAIESLFYKEHEISGKTNVLDYNNYKFIFYGNLGKLIRYGDENYNKLVDIFKTSDQKNESWADGVVNFMELNKNNIFPSGLINGENHKKNKKPRYYVKKIKEYANKPDKAQEQKKEIDEWLNELKKGKRGFSFKHHIINNYNSDSAIARFLFEIIKYRHEKNYKITSQDILKLSAFINDNNWRAKFKLIASGFLFLKLDNYDKLIKDDSNYDRIDARTPEQKQNDIRILFSEDSQETKFQAIKMAYSDRSSISSELLKNYIKCFKDVSGQEIKRYIDNRSKLTEQDLSEFSNGILDLYKKSLIDIKFIFGFGIDTGKMDSSGKFDEKRKAFIEFLDWIPEIGKLNFNPDGLDDDQKYLIIVSLVHNEFGKIKTDGEMRFVFDKFSFENLNLEKYKLNPETKKMVTNYIREYAENYFADSSKYGHDKESLTSKRDNLESKLKELKQELLKINSEQDYKTKTASTQESVAESDERKKLKKALDDMTNRKETLQNQLDALCKDRSNLSKDQSNLKDIGIILVSTIVFSVFSLICFFLSRKKENEINKISNAIKENLEETETVNNEIEVINNKIEEPGQRYISQDKKSLSELVNYKFTITGQIEKIENDIKDVNQELDVCNNFFDRLLRYIDKIDEEENIIIPKKQKDLTDLKEPLKIANKNQVAENHNYKNRDRQ